MHSFLPSTTADNPLQEPPGRPPQLGDGGSSSAGDGDYYSADAAGSIRQGSGKVSFGSSAPIFVCGRRVERPLPKLVAAVV